MAANDPPADRAPATTARVNATRARANSDNSNTTATAASSARRIRFVPGGLRGRKRRRACRPQNEQRIYSQATAGEDPSALSNEVVMPAGTDGDSVFPNTQKASNVPDDWGMNFPLPNQGYTILNLTHRLGTEEDSLLGDAGLFDPDLIANTFFNLEPQEPPAVDVPDMLALSKTLPFKMTDRVDERATDSQERPEILAHDLDAVLAEPLQPNLVNQQNYQRIEMDIVANSLLPLNDVLRLPEVDINDHDGLLQLCTDLAIYSISFMNYTDTKADDSKFCVLPLTSDMAVNPFRCQRQTSQGSRLLFHSIMALCCHHLDWLTGSWSTEASKHRTTAVQLLECALQADQAKKGLHLLEPILIMFTLDVSALLNSFCIHHVNICLFSAHCLLLEPGQLI